MSSLSALTLGEAIENRRSVHKLSDDVSVPDSRIEEILRHAVLHSPTPFNCQSGRTVLLVKDEHKKFWDLAREIAQATEPPALFEKVYEPRTKMFRAAYGTILFYDDLSALEATARKWPMLKDKFPQWLDHASGMLQYAVWTMLAAEGLGCNLQHYNPMVDDRVARQWDIPATWSLKAQMVFGTQGSPPIPKQYEPVEKRLLTYGV